VISNGQSFLKNVDIPNWTPAIKFYKAISQYSGIKSYSNVFVSTPQISFATNQGVLALTINL